MTRRRGPFDDRLKRLEQTTELPEPGEQDVYGMPERESAVALESGNRVFRPIQVFKDEAGNDYYGITNGEGTIEPIPQVHTRQRKGHRPKYASSGTS